MVGEAELDTQCTSEDRSNGMHRVNGRIGVIVDFIREMNAFTLCAFCIASLLHFVNSFVQMYSHIRALKRTVSAACKLSSSAQHANTNK
jgi:hypothetical protein